jgi:hypothetical protein
MKSTEMFTISNEEAAKDPDTVQRMLKYSKIDSHYSDNCFFISKGSKEPLEDKIKVEEIQWDYLNYRFDESVFNDNLSCMSLDHKKMGYNLSYFMEELNSILSSFNLKLVDIDTQSDYMMAFITKIEAQTPTEMIIGALEIQGLDKNLIDKIVIKEDYPHPIKSKNEYSVEDALRFIVDNSNIQDETVNFDVLIEFLEDNAPEFEYGLSKRAGKTYVTIKKFDD